MTKILPANVVYYIPVSAQYPTNLNPNSGGGLIDFKTSFNIYQHANNITRPYGFAYSVIDNQYYIDMNGINKMIRTDSNYNYKNGESIQIDFDFIVRSVRRNILYTITNQSGTGGSTNYAFKLETSTTGFIISFGGSSFSVVYDYKPNVKYSLLLTLSPDDGLLLNINGESISNFDKNEVLEKYNLIPNGTYFHFLGHDIYTSSSSAQNVGLDGYISNIITSSGYYIHREHKDYTTNDYNKLLQFNFSNVGGSLKSKPDIVNNLNIIPQYTISSGKIKIDEPISFNVDNGVYINCSIDIKSTHVDNVLFKIGSYEVRLSYVYVDTTPVVEVNEYTTSALDFEDGLVDQIGTTIWQKEGTADVTSINPIFGASSFETKALGDSLSTTSQIITGGSTPFTIEFYALVNGSFSANNNFFGAGYALLSQNRGGGDSDQQILVDANLNAYLYRGANGGASPFQLTRGLYKNLRNELNKYTFTYDGSALRLFINDQLDIIVGTNNGWDVTNPYPFTFFDNLVNGYSQYRVGTKGLIDNINIHDGIATKVRDPDPYEEYLVVDLPFDGENNSTKIVDNGGDVLRSSNPYNNNIISLLHFEGIDDSNIIIDETGRIWNILGSSKIKTDQKVIGSSSCYFDGNSSVSSSLSSDFAYGTGNFTWEFFTRLNVIKENQYFIDHRQSNGNDGTISYYQNTLRYYNPTIGINSPLYNTNISLDINKWYHIAIVRNNNITSIYVDGIIRAAGTDSHNFGNMECWLGTYSRGGNSLNGYIDEFRIIKGKAVYTENFTPPTEPFKYIPKNNWTVVGSAKISTAKKFDGFSSLYVDGGGMSRIGSNLSLNLIKDFTISFEFIKENGVAAAFFDTRANTTDYTNAILITFPSVDINSINVYMNGLGNVWNVSLNSGTFIELNKKYKVDIICKSNKLQIYVNGILKASQQYDFDVFMDIDSRYSTIGKNVNGTGGTLQCYIKNFKIYKGVAVIPEDSTGKIQLDFDNNVIDKYGNSTWTNNGVTFDDVNSVSGKSVYFNGSSKLKTNSNSDLNFETKNFLISMDVKLTSMPNTWNSFISSGVSGDASVISYKKDSLYTRIRLDGSNYLDIPSLITTNNFYMIEQVRFNDSIIYKINNIIQGVYNTALPLNHNRSNQTTIGGLDYNSDENITGYIDNFKSYKEDLLANNDMTIFTDPTVTVNYKILDYCIYVTGSGATSSSNGTSIIRLNESPSLKNFTAEIELYFDATNAYMYGGLIFRTMEYKIRTPQMGYLIYFTVSGGKTHLRFGKGSNSSTDLWTQIHTVDVDSYRNNTYRTLKVIAKDNNFKAYIDNILIFDVIDDSYNISSQFGMNSFNYFNTAMYSKTKRVDIWDENGNYVYHKDWKSKVNNVIDRPAVHLPLETNAINTGFTSLTINSVGSPTYTTIDGKKCIKFESGKYITINSNNIFNLGTNSDFYIEMDIYFDDVTSTNWQRVFAINSSLNQFLVLKSVEYGDGYLHFGTTRLVYKTYLLNKWTNIKIKRQAGIISILVDDMIFESTDVFNITPYTTVSIGTDSGYKTPNTDYIRGYMSNFKMFVGTSEIPETYNDKKVLDLDFKPTGKSYLFKDNNNKCIIHPVNITQRDYQDSQYCCTFNGTNQYLQLGKNDLLNFGNDDFIIYLKFYLDSYNIPYQTLLGAGGTTGTRCYITILGGGETNTLYRRKIRVGATGGLFLGTSTNDVNIGLNECYIIRKDNICTIILNNISSVGEVNNLQYNLNFNNNTTIGRNEWDGANGYFKGIIYSIKVLRNTTDLSLLESVDNDEVAIEYKLMNTQTEDERVISTRNSNSKIEVDKNDSDVIFTVDEETVSLPVDDNDVEGYGVELFGEYNDFIGKDLVVYDKKPVEPSKFAYDPLYEESLEHEELFNSIDELEVYQYFDSGDYVIDGFTEGYPNAKYKIVSDIMCLDAGTDTFFFDGINPTVKSDYYIYLYELDIKYPIPTQKMERGYITYYMSDNNQCKGADYCIRLSRRDTGRVIGVYEFVDGYCRVDNLDCNHQYDAILFDRTNTYESIPMSNRTPRPVE